jgi:hypothetical protein
LGKFRFSVRCPHLCDAFHVSIERALVAPERDVNCNRSIARLIALIVRSVFRLVQQITVMASSFKAEHPLGARASASMRMNRTSHYQ